MCAMGAVRPSRGGPSRLRAAFALLGNAPATTLFRHLGGRPFHGRDEKGQRKKRRPVKQDGDDGKKGPQQADRSLLLADAERLEDLHHARGMRAALHGEVREHRAGEQFKPEFLAITPNNRMPAIVDPDGPGGRPISVFESGAILLYLGRKTGKFYPADVRARIEVDQWLFWQMGGLGPMAGQAHHFRAVRARKTPYAIERYTNE